MSRGILAAALSAVVLASCGEGNDTTVINNTTTVTEAAQAGSAGSEDSGAAPKVEEYSGPCEPAFGRPMGAEIAWGNLETALAECDYAISVANAWAAGYGSDCYEGCTKTFEDIPCTTDAGVVVCSAAQTEVRWDIIYPD